MNILGSLATKIIRKPAKKPYRRVCKCGRVFTKQNSYAGHQNYCGKGMMLKLPKAKNMDEIREISRRSEERNMKPHKHKFQIITENSYSNEWSYKEKILKECIICGMQKEIEKQASENSQIVKEKIIKKPQ